MASEDAYTSERTLVLELIARAQPRPVSLRPLLLYDRHPVPLRRQPASFVIRQFERLRWRIVKDIGPQGRVDTGAVSEQRVEVEDPDTGQALRLRSEVGLTLDTPT